MFVLEPLYFVLPLISGFLLDLLFGDPSRLPHPVRWMGHSVAYFDRQFNTGRYCKTKGILVVLALVGFVWGILTVIMEGVALYPQLYIPLASILVYYGLANRQLLSEVLKVERALRNHGVKEARKQLSMIVGRDTSELSARDIRRAVLETLSENLSDGVIAPLFFYAIGGIPLMFAYKMVNTLDSMIGYKHPKYKEFGWFAAKLDDVANYIPARLTAFLMALLTLSGRGFKYIFLYGHKHASPNAGYPEAVLAGVLNCRFGGPGRYHGKIMEKPYIGKSDRNILHADVWTAIMINVGVSITAIGILTILNV